MRFPKEEATFAAHLRTKGLKNTPERLEVLRAIFGRERHFAVEDLVRDLHRRGHAVSRATIYRTLTLLSEVGLIREAVRGSGFTHYEHVHGADHHDHLLCVRCGAVVEFVSSEIERLQEEVCSRHGFTPFSHAHQINGLCRKCRA